ncbi:MAG: methyltransferase domain-containing protein [Candidatus Jordarchaeaceae archaeon]
MKDKNQELFLGFVEGLVNYAPEDMDEGFGTFYERFMMNQFLKKLVKRYKFKSIFEGPSDGITGIRGINSFPMVEEGCELVYYTPSEREKELVVETWEKIRKITNKRLEVKICHGPPLNFPFENNYFDLVWNFCIMEHFYNPLLLLEEMRRISKKYVLIMTQNVWNIGTLPHIIYHKIIRKPWDHGNVKWMSFNGIEKLIEKVDLEIIEKGMLDIPIWPDTWDVPIRGLFKKVLSSRGRSWNWNILSDVSMKKEYPLIRLGAILEYGSLPKTIKLLWTHHLYVLCGKKR